MMKKTCPKSIQANWGSVKKRPTWAYVTSAELAEVLGVHLQTINNWKLRSILPVPSDNKMLRGNKNYYCIAAIRSWLEDKPEEEIHQQWVEENIPHQPITIAQAKYLTCALWKEYGYARKPSY